MSRLTGRSGFGKSSCGVNRSWYQEGMTGVMCRCLCSAVTDVLEVLETPATNPVKVCGEASLTLQGLERG